MNGVNLVILVGRLGADPEIRYMPSGAAVASFTLATTEKWKDKQTNENQERTEWSRITAFGRLAEICGEYLRKGSQVYVQGKLRTDVYEKEGQKHYTTKIIIDRMQMLGDKKQQEPQSPRASDKELGEEAEFKDDDIPF